MWPHRLPLMVGVSVGAAQARLKHKSGADTAQALAIPALSHPLQSLMHVLPLLILS
jgi:hypothetical protein